VLSLPLFVPCISTSGLILQHSLLVPYDLPRDNNARPLPNPLAQSGVTLYPILNSDGSPVVLPFNDYNGPQSWLDDLKIATKSTYDKLVKENENTKSVSTDKLNQALSEFGHDEIVSEPLQRLQRTRWSPTLNCHTFAKRFVADLAQDWPQGLKTLEDWPRFFVATLLWTRLAIRSSPSC
jgi:hypothetical protein